MDRHLSGDLVAVDPDAVVAAEVLDDDVPVLARQPSVPPGNVPLGEADRVPLLAPDGDLVAHEGDDGLVPLVVFYDELQHILARGPV